MPDETKYVGDVTSISLSTRIPDFWCDEPELWFIQAEAVLDPLRASDDSRYQVVISKLGKEVLKQITDILRAPPPSGKYQTLKSRLCLIYAESDERKIQRLISETELGDQKPSQLLRRMRDLARGKLADETLIILWQTHLPATVRGVLAATQSKDIGILGSVADRIFETTAHRESVSRVDPPPESSGREPPSLVEEIRNISERLRGLEYRQPRPRYSSRGGPRSRYSSPGRSSSRRRTPSDPDWLCHYHFRFRERANRCQEPCSWNRKKAGNE